MVWLAEWLTSATISLSACKRRGLPPVEWRVSDGLTPYETALAVMDERVAAIAAGRAAELVWLLEHPPLYTAGTSAQAGRPGRGAVSGASRPAAAASSPITAPASGWSI